jgi:hypothetical protein
MKKSINWFELYGLNEREGGLWGVSELGFIRLKDDRI